MRQPEPTAPFFQPTVSGCVLRLLVAPGASRTEVAGLQGDRLKVRISAPPARGAANKKLLDFLAGRLGLPKSAMRLTRGGQSREKTVEILDLSPDLASRVRHLLSP